MKNVQVEVNNGILTMAADLTGYIKEDCNQISVSCFEKEQSLTDASEVTIQVVITKKEESAKTDTLVPSEALTGMLTILAGEA